MNLRLGHYVNEGLHQTRRFTLAEEGGRSSNDSFSSRYIHSLEEEPRKVLYDPLHDTDVI